MRKLLRQKDHVLTAGLYRTPGFDGLFASVEAACRLRGCLVSHAVPDPSVPIHGSRARLRADTVAYLPLDARTVLVKARSQVRTARGIANMSAAVGVRVQAGPCANAVREFFVVDRQSACIRPRAFRPLHPASGHAVASASLALLSDGMRVPSRSASIRPLEPTGRSTSTEVAVAGSDHP